LIAAIEPTPDHYFPALLLPASDAAYLQHLLSFYWQSQCSRENADRNRPESVRWVCALFKKLAMFGLSDSAKRYLLPFRAMAWLVPRTR
jgi:hypothetical protein